MSDATRIYETLYLIRPDIKEDELSAVRNKVVDSISNNSGAILKNEKWSERDLAYAINDYTRGTYYIIIYKALPNVVSEIEKHLRFYKNDVLRFMTVKVDEDSLEETKVETEVETITTPEPVVEPTEEQKTDSESTFKAHTEPLEEPSSETKEPVKEDAEEPASETEESNPDNNNDTKIEGEQ